LRYSSLVPSRPSRAELQKQLERLRARALVARGRAERAEATESARERRRDTRRKVLLGGALQSLLRADRRLLVPVRSAVLEHLAARPQDANLFRRSDEERGALRQTATAGQSPQDAQAMLLRRKRSTHRRIILGAIALKLMSLDSELRSRIEAVLRASIATSPRDVALFELQGTETYLERLCDSSKQAGQSAKRREGGDRGNDTV
jgi:hypothetical protein